MPNKKRIILSFSIILFVAVFMLIFCYVKRDQLAFNHYVKEFTGNMLSSNALDLHYTIKEPTLYGVYEATPLPIYKKKDALNSANQYEKELFTLNKIDISALSEKDAFTYTVLHDYLEENLELEKYPYYAEPLTPNSGVHTTLPILLAEYTFYTTDDIDNYFELLAAIPEYLSSVLLYETEKADAGLFMNSIALDKVVSACEEFADCTNISEHLLVTSFQDRLEALCTSYNNLSQEELENYLKKNETLLKNNVFPAYLSFAEDMTSLSLYCNKNYTGLSSFPQGKDYYKALIKRNTGSYRSITDIKEMLFADFEESYIHLINLLSTHPELLETDCLNDFNSQFPLEDVEDILNHLQNIIGTDFPPLPATVNVSVKTVSKSLEDYCSPAFYLTVPIDAYDTNVIYLNKKNALTGLDLYTTLAHEGFPGHLYQTVYFHTFEIADRANDTPVANLSSLLRNILYYGGYTEGYALYVEFMAYDYASQLCDEAHIEDAKIICDTLKYEWQMQISLYCLLDIAIHYDGAGYEQVKSLLNKFGIVDDESTKAVYQYLLEEPTTYLKYYLGYLEIKNLKNIAMNLWGVDYSNLRFHTFLLESGPCSFRCLETKLLEE